MAWSVWRWGDGTHLHQGKVVMVACGLEGKERHRRIREPRDDPHAQGARVEALGTFQIPDLEDDMAEGLHLHGGTSFGAQQRVS